MCPFYLMLSKSQKAKDENFNCSDENPSVLDGYQFYRQLVGLSIEKCDALILSSSHILVVPHINQQRCWDCGLACVLMVLKTVGINNCNLDTLEELCCTTSIWTVDLAYLLHKFSVSFCYSTVTFGANPDFNAVAFYKDQLPNDMVRVDMLFRKALETGIHILCRSISERELSFTILSGKYIAIALVDQYKLSQNWSGDDCVSGIHCSGYLAYTGHYIVICGYDMNADEFEIRDPASSREHERISSKGLAEARKSFGTDEDLLLISLVRKARE